MMKLNLSFGLMSTLLMGVCVACEYAPFLSGEGVDVDKDCPTGMHARVEDHTGLDGCGYLLKLDNGQYLEPMLFGFCGTPPISDEVKQHPLYGFTFRDGMEVLVDYEKVEGGSICMVGPLVEITCIQEVVPEESKL